MWISAGAGNCYKESASSHFSFRRGNISPFFQSMGTKTTYRLAIAGPGRSLCIGAWVAAFPYWLRRSGESSALQWIEFPPGWTARRRRSRWLSLYFPCLGNPVLVIMRCKARHSFDRLEPQLSRSQSHAPSYGYYY